MAAGMMHISSTNTIAQTVSSCKYIMRPSEAILVMSTIDERKGILKQVEQYAQYEKIGSRELGIRGRHDAQIMKKVIMSLPNEMELDQMREKLSLFLERSGIGEYPYLVCVHRGEKDGIINRHVHINFFQRRFESGRSNKERRFVKKTFAEETRTVYQEVFGFSKNAVERVRLPRQDFWKYKANGVSLREEGKRVAELEMSLQQMAAMEEVKGADHRKTEDFLRTGEEQKGAKSENKAIGDPDDQLPVFGSSDHLETKFEHPRPQEIEKSVSETDPSPALSGSVTESGNKKGSVRKWEMLLGQQAYQAQERHDREQLDGDLALLTLCQQKAHTVGHCGKIAGHLIAHTFSADLQEVGGQLLNGLQSAVRAYVSDQKDRERNGGAGSSPTPDSQSGQQLLDQLKEIDIDQLRYEVMVLRKNKSKDYRVSIMVETIKGIRSQRPALQAMTRRRLIESQISQALRKPVGENREGMNVRMNLRDNIESLAEESIAEGDTGQEVTGQLMAKSRTYGRKIIERVSTELEVEEKEVESVYRHQVEKLVEETVEEVERQYRKRNRGLDRGGGYGLGM